MIWIEGARQSAKFQTSTAHVKFQQIYTLKSFFY